MSAAQEKVAVETGVGVATAYLLDGDKGGPLSSILVKELRFLPPSENHGSIDEL